MRIVLFSLVLALVAACASPQPAEVERIEIRLSGWTAMDIQLNREGMGSFQLSRLPDGNNGSFSITRQQFERFVERLEPFREEAVPLTEESGMAYALGGDCPEGAPWVTDAGAVWIHWVGPDSDEHYLAEFGCDRERNAARNQQLRDIIFSLPVPSEY